MESCGPSATRCWPRSTTSWRGGRPEGGYFLWVDFGAGTDAGDLLGRATEAGVTFVRGADFFPGGEGGATSARLAFSYEAPERIAEGVRVLAGLL